MVVFSPKFCALLNQIFFTTSFSDSSKFRAGPRQLPPPPTALRSLRLWRCMLLITPPMLCVDVRRRWWRGTASGRRCRIHYQSIVSDARPHLRLPHDDQQQQLCHRLSRSTCDAVRTYRRRHRHRRSISRLRARTLSMGAPTSSSSSAATAAAGIPGGGRAGRRWQRRGLCSDGESRLSNRRLQRLCWRPPAQRRSPMIDWWIDWLQPTLFIIHIIHDVPILKSNSVFSGQPGRRKFAQFW